MLRALLPLVALGAALALSVPPGQRDLWSLDATGERLLFAHDASLMRASAPVFAPADVGGGLVFNTLEDVLVEGDAQVPRPAHAFTVRALVSVETPRRWGGIVGRIEDNGGFEKGWLVGYDEERFTFALSTAGADDGDGKLTYLRGRTSYGRGALHHVVATYDGEVARLYVDGRLDAETREQSGAVLHPDVGAFVVGAYRDQDEAYPHDGRIVHVSLAEGVAPQDELELELATAGLEAMASLGLETWDDTVLDFLVRPYLTWPTTSAMSVGFEATEPCAAVLRLRRDDAPDWSERMLEAPLAPCVTRLQGLEPDTKYFYQVELRGADGEVVLDDVRSFRTAASPGRPFTFVVIGDTQGQAEVARRVSELAAEHRPNLFVHAGDLVDTGSAKSDWTGHFFPNVGPFIAHTPLMPVLGNHEQDARHYYDYMDLPAPERWYSFTYGDAEFFMLDGNRDLVARSAQLEWLESTLAASSAKWRFAVLHQPPYTSDSNDYGETSEGPSTRGDMNVRNIVALLEEHDVDICFSGHVHDYERTFPIKGGAVVPYEDGGVVYVTAAGGGGSLEDFDATNTWFGHKKARRHHLVYVALHGDHLELQAIDEDGRLFDALALTKRGR